MTPEQIRAALRAAGWHAVRIIGDRVEIRERGGRWMASGHVRDYRMQDGRAARR